MYRHNDAFICRHCQKSVSPHASSERNHCPFCLYSCHRDLDQPGDRLSLCQGLMKPDRIEYSGKKGFIIVHRCEKCGKESKNQTAPDDNWDKIIELSQTNLL